jgi:hypothetical protein
MAGQRSDPQADVRRYTNTVGREELTEEVARQLDGTLAITRR